MVGPTDDGCFLELRVCSIQRNRSACRVLRAGQAATLALGDFDRALLRKVRWKGGLERKHKEKCLGGWLPGEAPKVLQGNSERTWSLNPRRLSGYGRTLSGYGEGLGGSQNTDH